jgi:hypothetical protein
MIREPELVPWHDVAFAVTNPGPIHAEALSTASADRHSIDQSRKRGPARHQEGQSGQGAANSWQTGYR